jgi:flavin prenyltransferase
LADYVVGITGASGSIYGVRLIQELAARHHHVNVVATGAGMKVMGEELGISGPNAMEKLIVSRKKVQVSIWHRS